jgi:hypothetical protein
MGKAAKEHRKKVQARNARLKQENRKREKFQKEFIMNLIKQEQEKGMFENNLNLDGGPVLDGPVLDGPVLDGPVLDGPVLDGPTLDLTTETITIDSPIEEATVIESPVVESSDSSEN